MPGGRRSFVGEVLSEFGEDRITVWAAALAYSAVFSLPPLLVLLVAVLGAVFGEEAAEGRIVAELGGLLGEEVAGQLQQAIRTTQERPGSGPVAGAVGLVALLVGATGAFSTLQSALNHAWDVGPDPERKGVRALLGTLFRRLLSFGMVLVIAALLLVAMVVSAALGAFGEQLAPLLGGLGPLALTALDAGVSLLVTTLLFAAMLRILPDARVAWRDVWGGAFVTAVLFVAGKYAIGLYLGRADVGSAYGAAGSLVVLLVWIYYASLVFFLGAEITQVWARRHGSRITPARGAVRVVEEVRYERERPPPPHPPAPGL